MDTDYIDKLFATEDFTPLEKIVILDFVKKLNELAMDQAIEWVTPDRHAEHCIRMVSMALKLEVTAIERQLDKIAATVKDTVDEIKTTYIP